MEAENGSGRMRRTRQVSDGSLVPKIETKRGGAPGIPKKPLEGEIVDSRAVAAFKLRLAGKPLWEIADELEMTEDDVIRAINTRMKTERSMISAGEREGIIHLQDARYEQIIASNWGMMAAGDDKAAQIILKAMHQKEQLLQLAALDPETSQRTVLVIGGKEADYVQSLKEASGQ